jgi:hypothetical protein
MVKEGGKRRLFEFPRLEKYGGKSMGKSRKLGVFPILREKYGEKYGISSY